MAERPTIYWSFITSQPSLYGWISIYDLEGNLHFTASINFGTVLTTEASQTLLEENSKMSDGFHYSTTLRTLTRINQSSYDRPNKANGTLNKAFATSEMP